MRVTIDTDLDEYGPEFATIDMCWEEPPPSIKVRWLPGAGPTANLVLQQHFVDMQDGDDPGGIKPLPYAAA